MTGTDDRAELDSGHEENHSDLRPFFLASAAVADPNAGVRCRLTGFGEAAGDTVLGSGGTVNESG